jgi:hypothetical protein
VIDESDLHFEKHLHPKISTLLGIKIDSSDDPENASDSIRVKREFDSNVIDESDLQYAKLYDPMISISLPISIVDDSEKLNQWMFILSIVLTVLLKNPAQSRSSVFEDAWQSLGWYLVRLVTNSCK